MRFLGKVSWSLWVLVSSMLAMLLSTAVAHAQSGYQIEVVPALTHSSGVNWNAVSKDGSLAVTGVSDGTVKLWDISTGRLIRTLQDRAGLVMQVGFTPDGTRVLSAGGAETSVKVWDIATGKMLQELNDHSGAVIVAVASPEAGHVLTTSTDNTAKLWDLATQTPIAKFVGHTDMVFTADILPRRRRC